MHQEKDRSSSIPTITIPTTIAYEKLEYSKGTQGAIEWVKGLKDLMKSVGSNVFRTAFESIIKDKGLYDPKFKSADEVKKMYNLKDGPDLEAMMKEIRASVAADKLKLTHVNAGVHAVLVSLMGRSSLEVLKMNLTFKQNDDMEYPNPDTTWKIIIETHITKRDGDDQSSMYMAAFSQVQSYLNLKQKKGEHLSEYVERDRYAREGLMAFGYDVEKHICQGEPIRLVHKWILGLEPSKYKYLQRDIKNNIIACPKTINEAAKLARARFEASDDIKVKNVNNANDVLSTLVTIGQETEDVQIVPDQTKQSYRNVLLGASSDKDDNKLKLVFGEPPLSPGKQYDMYDRQVWNKASKDERDFVIKHNRNIRLSAEKIIKQQEEARAKYKKKKDDGKKKESKKPSTLMTKEMENKNEMCNDLDFDYNGLVDEENCFMIRNHNQPNHDNDYVEYIQRTNNERDANLLKEVLSMNCNMVRDTSEVIDLSMDEPNVVTNTVKKRNKKGNKKKKNKEMPALIDSDSECEREMPSLVESDSDDDDEVSTDINDIPSVTDSAIARAEELRDQEQFDNDLRNIDSEDEWLYDSDTRNEIYNAKNASGMFDKEMRILAEERQNYLRLDELNYQLHQNIADRDKVEVLAKGTDVSDKAIDDEIDEIFLHYEPPKQKSKSSTHQKAKNKRNKKKSTSNYTQLHGDGGPALYNPNIPMIDAIHLVVTESKLRYGDTQGYIKSPGMCLQADVHIVPGQGIAYFNGDIVTEQDIKYWNDERRKFIIHLGDDKYLDCKECSETGDCIASMANTALKLYNRTKDIQYTVDDNNAAIRICGKKKDTIMLYATRKIERNQEILWDYGDTYWTELKVKLTLMAVQNKSSEQISYNPFNENYVTLDNASALHICKSQKWANNILPCSKPHSLSGIVEEESDKNIYNNTCNMVDSAFGRMALAPNAVSNIVSQSILVDKGFIVQYVSKDDLFIIINPKTKRKYVFGRMTNYANGVKHRYYVMDMRTNKPPEKQHHKDRVLLGTTVLIPTVHALKARYTKDEIKRADIALSVWRNMGYPPKPTAMEMVRTMRNCTIQPQDIALADSMYGQSIEAYRGRTNKRQAASSRHVPIHEKVQITQNAEVDLMFVLQRAYMTCIISPLEYSFVVPILNKTVDEVHKAIEGVLADVRKKGFKIEYLRTDNEKAIFNQRIQKLFDTEGITHDAGPAGGHSHIVERRIQFIKQKVRTLFHMLPYTPFGVLIDWMVMFGNRLTNMQRSTTSKSTLAPREKYVGRQIDFKKDFKAPFGAYVQTPVPNTDNTMNARTEAGIALMPKDTRTGTWHVYKILTGQIVSRDRLIMIPIPDKLINHINTKAAREGYNHKAIQENDILLRNTPDDDTDVQPVQSVKRNQLHLQNAIGIGGVRDGNEKDVSDENTNNDNNENSNIRGDDIRTRGVDINETGDTDYEKENNDTNEYNSQDVSVHLEDEYNNEQESHMDNVNPMLDNNAVVEVDTVSDDDEPVVIQNTTRQGLKMIDGVRRSTRIEEINHKKDIDQAISDRYWGNLLTMCEKVEHHQDRNDIEKDVTLLSNMTVRQAIEKHGNDGESAIRDEMLQFIDKDAFIAVDINKDDIVLSDIISSKMFIVTKYGPQGEFIKVKARLVARGDQQDKTLYAEDDMAAYTVEHSTVLMLMAIAHHEKRDKMVADIGGAFLHAFMPNYERPVYVRIPANLAAYITTRHTKFKSGLDKKGNLIVKLNKAMYGCVQAALLWFKHITNIIKNELNFKQSSYDPCLFYNYDNSGNQTTITIHVDDLFITSQKIGEPKRIIDRLKTHYEKISHEEGNDLNYLGQHFSFKEDGVHITMDKMTQSIIDDSMENELITKDIDNRIRTPAKEDLFEIDDADELLNKKDTDLFHTMVARLLYLAKRVKPEMLLVIAYLSTRVTKSTRRDMTKLIRALSYVHKSYIDGNKGIVLNIGKKGMQIQAWIDAAYGLHASGKSHTGSCICLGDAPIFYYSGKQNIVVKSSTEAELVGLSDSANQVIHVHRILTELGYGSNPAIIYQDNKSTISMIERGRSNSMRTRHIHIRYFWLHNVISDKVVLIKYKPTLEMGAANILTKVLQGIQFRTERYDVTKWNDNTNEEQHNE